MHYLLLNKDTVWLAFHCEQNEYMETTAQEDLWYTAQRPFGYTNLTDFLERRKAPKHRAHIAALLKEYGCDTLEGYLNVTHALSPNDTFWVKAADADLQWRDVSLYQNPFNEMISQAAFDGSVSSTSFSSTSPEFSTAGQYAKCWVREKDTIQLMNLDSTNIEPKHWLAMAACIETHYDEYDGFVICHGTDTMAFTAAALSYLIQHSPKPIVITGAQHPIDLEDTDARVNLMDSLRFAASEKAHDVCVVFDGKIIAGTRAKKEHSKSYNAFASVNYPYLGMISDGRVILYFEEPKEMGPVQFYHDMTASVGLVKLVPSMPADILDYVAGRCDAVIIEAYGVGGLPVYEHGSFFDVVHKWKREGKVFVMATQVAREGSNLAVYEVGKKVKEEAGVMEAYDMTLEAVLTKLMWILPQTKDAGQVKRLLGQCINRDILWTRK